MLVLYRKKGEALVIGDNIKISILDIGNEKVKIAIDAPKDISILRSELYEAAIENNAALNLKGNPLVLENLKNIIK